jgi:predicted AlkP superfamily pyrophosphatase or phosphodiesterase
MAGVLVLNVVGLTPELLHSGAMPALAAYAKKQLELPLQPPLPAVTCTAQADMLFGCQASEHGAVANGWYFREQSEVWLWRQSVHLVDGCGQRQSLFQQWKEKHPERPTAQVFWWWNLPGHADICLTPRPTYWSDGRKSPDVHSQPAQLGRQMQERLGDFPLFQFWGPGAGIASTRWIVEATLDILREQNPSLCMAYLPHLDYDLQRFGPNAPQAQMAARAVDQEVARLLHAAEAADREVVIVSEYGIEEVSQACFPNRILRDAGLLEIHPARNGALLDPGNSRAFAVCDHQVAHVYVAKDQDLGAVRELFEQTEGVERILAGEERAAAGLDHPRSGELVLVAKPGWWFAYPYWTGSDQEPDFARMVDIHRKPGYDPCELFLDPAKSAIKARIIGKLIAKKLGFRTLMNVVPLDTSLVRGSHGRAPSSTAQGPVWIGPNSLRPPQTGDEAVPMHLALQGLLGN